VKNLRPQDILVMPEIFYAGGTVARDISSKDLIADIVAGGRDARFCQNRFDVGMFLLSEAQPGDRVVIMGARDDTLSDFALGILKDLQAGNAPKLASNGARP
jgi:UDP-N-acetylmuramate--alanine ligase